MPLTQLPTVLQIVDVIGHYNHRISHVNTITTEARHDLRAQQESVQLESMVAREDEGSFPPATATGMDLSVRNQITSQPPKRSVSYRRGSFSNQRLKHVRQHRCQ